MIAGSADELVMMRNSELMVHDGLGPDGRQHAADMREMAVHLDRLSDNLADVYAHRAGGTVAYWRTVMRRETW